MRNFTTESIIKLLVLFTVILTAFVVVSCNKDDDDYSADSGTFTDSRDSQAYNWKKIGTQIWMTENFAYEPTSGDYWAFRNDPSNVTIYGYLYSWETAKNIAPSGWHLPNNSEWNELIDFLGGEDVAGGKMKTITTESGTAFWMKPNTGATNESGFSSLPAGLRYASGSFSFLNGHCRYWESNQASFYALGYNNENISYSNFTTSPDGEGYSVRFIKD